MNPRRMRWIGAILLMMLIAAVVGIGAYRMGVAQGLALGMAEVEGGRSMSSHAWHAHGYGWPGPWGFGFGFGFLVPLLFFFTWVAVLKMLFWRGRGPRGPWRGGWGGRRGPWDRGHYRGRGRWRDDDPDDARRSFDADWYRRGTTL